jgi:hypothetical protein
MPGSRPVISLALVGLGAAAMAVAVYSQSPRSFTTRAPPPLAPPVAVAIAVERLSVPPSAEFVLRESVAGRPARATIARPPVDPATIETRVVPCSEWREMVSGPEARRVRHLCPLPVRLEPAPVPRGPEA